MRSEKALRLAAASVPLFAVLVMVGSTRAATIYWDTNGASAGSTDTDVASGTWDLATSTNWSSDIDGLSSTLGYTAAGGGSATDVVFSAGSNATGNSAITVAENVAARGLTFEDGPLTLSGAFTINVRAGGITVPAGTGPVVIGNVSGGTKIQPQFSQTWANYSTNKLIIGGGLFGYNPGQIVTLSAGDIQLGNDGTNNTFASTAGIGAFQVDGARLIWSFSSSGIGSNTLTFKSGTLNNSSAKGLSKGFRLEGDFRFENKGNAWRDVTLGGTAGFNPTLTVDTPSVTSFTGYKLIGADQSLTINAATGRTVNVGFLADASNPGLILDGAGIYSLATGTSTMAGPITLKNGTFSIGADPVLTSGALTSSPLGVGPVKLAGGTVQAVTAARTIRNHISIDGDVAFGGAYGITFDGITDLTTPKTFTLTGDRTLTAGQTAGAISFIGAIDEDAAGRALTKAGAGQMMLGAGENTANSYTGLTTVSAGELGLYKAAGVLAIAGDLAITGGSVKLYADEQISDSSAVALAGTLDLSGFTETLGSLSVDSSTASLLGSVLNVGALSVDGVPQAGGSYNSSDFSWIGSTSTINVVAVPEPAVMGLLFTSALLGMRRRKH